MQGVLANHEGFVDAVKKAVEAQNAIKNKGKAADTLVNAWDVFVSEFTGHATIVNLSSQECTWFIYSDLDTIKLFTPFRSFMGAYSTITVHCPGFGVLWCFKSNHYPQRNLQRGKVYIFDGTDIHTAQSFLGK